VIEMGDNEANNKIKYLKLDTLEDVKALVCDVLTECRDTGSMVGHASKITQLLQVWLKAHQMSQLQDLEKRVEALEEGNK
jgi:hypothetical protein